MIILYVDDLIVLASDVAKLRWLKSKLEKKFEMSDFRELHYYLGVEFEKNKEACTITMTQRRYINKILKRFHMEEAN